MWVPRNEKGSTHKHDRSKALPRAHKDFLEVQTKKKDISNSVSNFDLDHPIISFLAVDNSNLRVELDWRAGRSLPCFYTYILNSIRCSYTECNPHTRSFTTRTFSNFTKISHKINKSHRANPTLPQSLYSS